MKDEEREVETEETRRKFLRAQLDENGKEFTFGEKPAPLGTCPAPCSIPLQVSRDELGALVEILVHSVPPERNYRGFERRICNLRKRIVAKYHEVELNKQADRPVSREKVENEKRK